MFYANFKMRMVYTMRKHKFISKGIIENYKEKRRKKLEYIDSLVTNEMLRQEIGTYQSNVCPVKDLTENVGDEVPFISNPLVANQPVKNPKYKE